MNFEPNDVIDERYRVVSLLGSGSSGTVYLAEDELLKRLVAVKVLGGESAITGEITERFHREAKILCQISHPNIVSIHRYGFLQNGCPFLVLDYVNGASLRQVMEQGETFTLQKAGNLVRQICEGLGDACERGIIHRDLKPENLLIEGPEQSQIKIIDFGLCKQVSLEDDSSMQKQAALTQTGVSIGTVAYMSPEQRIGHKLDWRSDIYSVACIFFEMLTGDSPIDLQSATEELSLRLPLISESYNVRDKTALAIDSFLQRAAAPVAAERFSSHDEMLSNLDALVLQNPDWTLKSAEKVRINNRRLMMLLTGSCLVVLLLLSISFAGVHPERKRQDPTLVLRTLEKQLAADGLEDGKVSSVMEFARSHQFSDLTEQRRFEYSVFQLAKKYSKRNYEERVVLTAIAVLRTLTREGKEYKAHNASFPDDFKDCVNEICAYLCESKHSQKIWMKISEAVNENYAQVDGKDIFAGLASANVYLLRAESGAASPINSSDQHREVSRHYAQALAYLYGAGSDSALEQMKFYSQRLMSVSAPDYYYGLFYGNYYQARYFLHKLVNASDKALRQEIIAKLQNAYQVCRISIRSGALGVESHEYDMMKRLIVDMARLTLSRLSADPGSKSDLDDLERYSSDLLFLAPQFQKLALSDLERAEIPSKLKEEYMENFESKNIFPGDFANNYNAGLFYAASFYGHAYKYVVDESGRFTSARRELALATDLASKAGGQSEEFIAFLKAAKDRNYPK